MMTLSSTVDWAVAWRCDYLSTPKPLANRTYLSLAYNLPSMYHRARNRYISNMAFYVLRYYNLRRKILILLFQ